MKKLILIGIVALVVFMILKALLVIVSKITEKAFKVSDKKRDRFEFPLSVAIQLLFILIWLMSSEGVANKFGLNNLEFYISFCMIGIFWVFWCYFSWDMEHIFVKPCISKKRNRMIKKISIYASIFIFVIIQGYFQTLHAMDPESEINMMFSVTNYSIVVAIIALDRIMNQIVAYIEERKKRKKENVCICCPLVSQNKIDQDKI